MRDPIPSTAFRVRQQSSELPSPLEADKDACSAASIGPRRAQGSWRTNIQTWSARGKKHGTEIMLTFQTPSVPSHGRGRRFNPYSAHHFSSTYTAALGTNRQRSARIGTSECGWDVEKS